MEVDPVEFAALRTDVTSALTGVATLSESLAGVHEDVKETLRNAKLTNGRVSEIEKRIEIDRAVADALSHVAKEGRLERRQDVRAFAPGFINTLVGAGITTAVVLLVHFL